MLTNAATLSIECRQIGRKRILGKIIKELFTVYLKIKRSGKKNKKASLATLFLPLPRFGGPLLLQALLTPPSGFCLQCFCLATSK